MTTYNWYFSQSGNDTTGDGSYDNPWKSLAKAQTQINLVNTNDIANLFFKRGDIWTADTAAVVRVNNYGLLIGIDDPVVNIDAYGLGSNPIFDGQVTNFAIVPAHNASVGPFKWNRIFEFKRNNCSVKNFTIKQCYGEAVVLTNADNFILQYCTLYSLGSSGINQTKDYNIENITVANNTIHTAQQLYRYSKRPGWGGAIGLGKSISGPGAIGHVIRHNLIYDVYGEGIIGPGSIVEYNVIGDTWSYGIHVAPFDNDGHDITVRYNLVIGSNSATYKLGRVNGSGIVHFDETYGVGSNAEADIEIYGNIVINRGFGIRVYDMDGDKSIKVFNNLCIDNVYNYYFDNPGEVTKGYIYNNSSILYNRVDKAHTAKSTTFPHPNWTVDNNHFWTKGESPIVDDGWRTNMITGDPKLSGEPTTDWVGQSGPTYYKDIKFSDLYPLPGSALFGSGKSLGVGFDNVFLTKGSDFSTLPDNPKFNLALQPEYGNWDIGAIVPSDAIDPCKDVVCPNVCIGTDLYSQKCDPATGNCVTDQLIEINSITCGYVPPDPCEGVICEDVCIGTDLYSQKCDPATGNCVTDQLIESNSVTCGYDPCEGVVCDNICVGNNLYSQKCEGGSCVTDQLLESNSVTCGHDPCAGVVCDNICIGKDLWSQKCEGGSCVPDQLLESNSVTCGYDPCAGVVCENVCVGNNLYSQKCEGGTCVPDQLLETNSSLCDIELCEGFVCSNVCVGDDLWSQRCIAGMCVSDQLLERDSLLCGYIPTDPCEGVVCPNVCIGNNLFSQRCIDGTCFPYQLLETDSELCELCKDVVCGNICVGNDLWSQICDPDTGECMLHQLLQQDSINCIIPDQVPSDESTIKTYIILGGFGLMGLGLLLFKK